VISCQESYQQLEELERQIGYTFTDKLLLRKAMTHAAYSVQNELAVTHNERLEFLGDSVLDVVVSHYLFEKFKTASEGKMSQLRTRLVRNTFLAITGQKLNLNRYILHYRYHDIDSSIVADTVEALIGAIYIGKLIFLLTDHIDGDLGAATNFIYKFIINDVEQEILQHDPYFEQHDYHSFELPFIAQVLYYHL
jgi:ribonuclease-3